MKLRVLFSIFLLNFSFLAYTQVGLGQLLNLGSTGYNSVMNAARTASTTKVGTSGASQAAALQQAKMLGVDPNIIKLLTGGKAEEQPSGSGLAGEIISSILDPDYAALMLEMRVKQDSMFLTLDSMRNERVKLKDIDISNEIFGHRFFSTDNLQLFLKSTDTKAPDSYVLGVGDELLISVWGYADYNNKFKIGDDGYIQEKEFGRLYLKGITFVAAKAVIGKRLNTFINPANTKYEISLNYSRSIDINLVGEVITPGTYKIPAINSVFNAVNAADGVTRIGTVRNIQVKREGKLVKTFDLHQFLFNPMPQDNFYLQSGDFVYVPVAEKLVKVQGAVRRPSIYELKSNEGLNELIVFAGGLKPDAFIRTIQITRYVKDKTEIINIDYEKLMFNNENFKLNDGDIVDISFIPNGVENGVNISGSVRFPGRYQLKENYRISDVIIMAGGIRLDAYIDRAYLKRKMPDQSEVITKFSLSNILLDPNSADNFLLQKDDKIEIFSQSNFAEKFMVSIQGAVLKPAVLEYSQNLTLNDLLFYAGGLKTEAANSKIEISRVIDVNQDSLGKKYLPKRIVVKTISIGSNLEIDEVSKAFRLSPMDLVDVRKTPGFAEQMKITLSGEVVFPGSYTILDKFEKVLDVIQRAGGLTPYAHIQSAKLIRPDFAQNKTVFELKDAFKDPNSRSNLILKDGDLIEIPTVNQLIRINGAIRYPHLDSAQTISGKFVAGKSARWYVKNYAGGFEKSAKKKNTMVLYPNGKVEYTKSFMGIKNYPTIDVEGAIVNVEMKKQKPKAPSVPREPVSLNILLPSLIAGVTSALSTALLIIFLK
ncbi:MAG: SLBB domain-containing protein [Sphingobacteriales bacterium]|nr:MAG: SLBB domain-containing protein [Sphingobacteriales bacterium]